MVADLLLLAGCIVTSDHPFFTAKDVLFDETLVGPWADQAGPNAAGNNREFAPANERACKLMIRVGDEATAILLLHEESQGSGEAVQEVAIADRPDFSAAEKARHAHRPEPLLNHGCVVIRLAKEALTPAIAGA